MGYSVKAIDKETAEHADSYAARTQEQQMITAPAQVRV
jgi:hypothetical protein